MDAEALKLWGEYLLAERDRVQPVMVAALDRFIEHLLQQPESIWQAWARDLAASVSDQGADCPVRLPLFRRVLLPTLAEGVRRGTPGCARWLASFESLLSKSSLDDLALELRSATGLLKEAVRLDPADDLARRRLMDRQASYLEYTIHELPDGVLCGGGGATAEKCDELLSLLSEFKQHLAATSEETRFADLISDCDLHFRAYGDYLRGGPLPGGYAEYLQRRGVDGLQRG